MRHDAQQRYKALGLRAQPAQGLRQQPQLERIPAAYAERPRRILAHGAHPPARDVEEPQYLAGVLREEIALLREAHATARAAEEPDAQLVLERAYLMAHRRLREAQLLRRAGKVQAVRHRQEALELCGIQTNPPPLPPRVLV